MRMKMRVMKIVLNTLLIMYLKLKKLDTVDSSASGAI